MEVKTEADLALADALIALQRAYDREDEVQTRLHLGNVLAFTNGPDWRENEALVARVREVGVRVAAEGLLRRYL